jgi:hypothetical protein
MGMFLIEIHVCVRLWETEERKIVYILSLSLELIKVIGYDLPHSCDGPRKSPVF